MVTFVVTSRAYAETPRPDRSDTIYDSHFQHSGTRANAAGRDRLHGFNAAPPHAPVRRRRLNQTWSSRDCSG